MANDATSKPAATSNNSDNTTLPNTDQQKVPPLRIVLNTASNQKSSTVTVGSQETNPKKEKAQDVKTEGTLKVGGRVRIKLGTNKHQSTGKNDSRSGTEGEKITRGSITGYKIEENINEDSASSFTHLRRITRRSQRTIQTINNEDEESISSMTSTDENQNANNNQINSDNNTNQELEQSVAATTTSNSTTTTAATGASNGSSNSETPRRYKRRKVESSESQSIEYDNFLGSQNYKLPNQNSFELFKNIRQQVDKKLKNLANVHPRTPYGFRDYLITRGAYLLDGNKLGNGTNLFMNEDGGLNPAPMGKYHAIRRNRTNYSVPSRAKVPLGLPVNSPLYDLFVEQEKDRYRMRIQHIKEREKLTLAAEQEIMRVYNQAALTAAEQTEPFSVCTMLKHQEIYNYMDSDGVTILSREDAQQDQAKQDGVRTRRRQHGQISPGPTTRKNSDADESNATETVKKETDNTTAPNDNQKVNIDAHNSTGLSGRLTTQEKDDPSCTKADEMQKVGDHDETKESNSSDAADDGKLSGVKANHDAGKHNTEGDELNSSKSSNRSANNIETEKNEASNAVDVQMESTTADKITVNLNDGTGQKLHDEFNLDSKIDDSDSQNPDEAAKGPTYRAETRTTERSSASDDQISTEDDTNNVRQTMETGSSLSIEDRQTQCEELFLSHLQEIDDKWDRIRHEMLTRHKNEAESLHAIQKLEWEWKTKEIGACDVRTTLVIDNTLVPKLSIYSQDY